ncbi:MAG: hypothetical protein ACRDHN_18940 [Thermomicrobiales bacterium]
MKLTEDLKSAWLIHAKGLLFVVLGLLAAGLLIFQTPTLRTALLIAITVWAFCRFYYYLFYVLERYLGREKKFAGLFDALGYLLFQKGRVAKGAEDAASEGPIRPNSDGR